MLQTIEVVKVRNMCEFTTNTHDIFYILCHNKVSAVATNVAISLDCWDAINEEVVGVSLSNEFHA